MRGEARPVVINGKHYAESLERHPAAGPLPRGVRIGGILVLLPGPYAPCAAAVPEGSGPTDMTAVQDLAIVVPAYNEAARIAATLQRLRDHLLTRDWRWEIVVVDDGLSDDTARVVEEVSAMDPRVRGAAGAAPGQGGSRPRGTAGIDSGLPVHLRCGLVDAGARVDRFMPPELATPMSPSGAGKGQAPGVSASRCSGTWRGAGSISPSGG